MKLLIVSHTEHYTDGGVIKGWGPTVREIDYLSQLFDEVVHVAPLYAEAAPASAVPYRSTRVRLRPVRPSGGPGLRNKLSILTNIPAYGVAVLRELRSADVVHVRCPANISLLAVLMLTLVRHPKQRWVKYAGNWKPRGREAWSYTVQRWWLERGLHRGLVTVNGQWPGQPPHVHSFLNPCLTDEELDSAQPNAQRQLAEPVRLIYVGQLNAAKGVGRALQALAELRRRGVDAQLDLIGDGEARPAFEQTAHTLGVAPWATFHGWLPRTALGAYYANAHIMLFPTDSSEGWPKVLSEAMAYGVVPVSGNVSSIPQYLQQFGTGRALDPYDVTAFADTIFWYTQHPEEWQRESANGMQAARAFSYSAYLAAVRKLLGLNST